MTPIERLINTAKQETGYLEKATNSQLDEKVANAGFNNWTKYARDLDNAGVYVGKKNGYAWCDIFVDWCFIQTFGLDIGLKMTGQQLKCYGAGCTESAKYYKNIGRFYTKNPKPGDQIFFLNKSGGMAHTGIVIRVDKTRVYTIEGNTSLAQGVIPNGGGVYEKSYLLTYNKIGGYGRPKYELVEDDEDMTDQTFDKMMEGWLARKGIMPATFEQEAIKWAKDNEIMFGDQTGNFAPKRPITRGEAIVVFKRFFDNLVSKK